MARPDHHPRDGEAAEYVLGTLPPDERTAFQRDMARDPALARAVRTWEEALAPLNDRVADAVPSPRLWQAVEAALDTRTSPQPAPASPATAADLTRLRRSRSGWRAAAVAAAALAAALALYVAVPSLAPQSPPLVAVVNRSGDLPALIVRVDGRAGTVEVRAVETETPAGRSLELWSIVGGGPPRSLGLVGEGPPAKAVPAEDRAQLLGATLAVSVEPPGGSTTGAPTGPVVYKGRLIRDR